MIIKMILKVDDYVNWYIVEGQDLYSEDEFDPDLYQDRDYDVCTFDVDYGYDTVSAILIDKGKMW